MADPWDDDATVAAPWDLDLNVNDAIPAASKSERVLRDLSVFRGRFDPVGVLETGLAVGSGLINEAGRGLAGIAGTGAGIIEGGFENLGLAEDDGETPNEVANKWMNAVPDITYEPRTQGGAAGMEMLGKGAELGVDATKFIGSGYAGLGALAAGADAVEATRSMQDFRETDNALAEGTYQVTKSPTMAAVAQILPEVASMGVPVKTPKMRVPVRDITPDMPPSGFGGVGDVDVRPQRPGTGQEIPIPETGPGGRPVRPEMGQFERLRDAIQRGDKAAILEEVNGNPAIVAAFEQLGIEFTPSMVSDNAALRQIEAGLASKADSGLTPAYELTEFKLNQAAQDLIDDAGGGSRAGVSQDIEARYEEIHSGMRKEEGVMWDRLDTKVPRESLVDVQAPANRIYREAELAGGGDIDRGLRSLRQHERRLFEMTHERVRKPDPDNPEQMIESWEYREPSYAAVNRFREDLGNSMNSGKPFGDANKGMLDQMYGEMAAVQGKVAKSQGFGDDWAKANAATVERKGFEEAMKRTLGSQLQMDAIARVDTAMKSLLDGKPKKWDELFNDLPVDQRQAAAAQALDQVFFTAGKKTKMSESFVKNFEKIKRDAQLRDRIFDQLPMDARSQFMAIGDAATGFYRAMEKLNRSNTANAMQVIGAIEQPGFMNRVLGGTAERVGGRVPIMGDWIRQITARTPEAKKAGAMDKIKAGVDLLADPAMHRAIVEYAAGRVDRANEILRGSQTWLQWAKTQPLPMQERLQSAGIVALFEDEENE